jgi:hypothetical protein
MGMFDDVEFKYRMPDGYEGRSFQSKSLDCTGDEYVVMPEGRLHRRYSSGYPDDVRKPLGDIAFDGELNIYTSELGTDSWHEYDLIFVQGDLRTIRCYQTDGHLIFEPLSVQQSSDPR